MEWIQVWTIIGTILGVNIAIAAAMITLMVWVTSKHDAEIKSIVTRIDGHASRIDQLYQMFCDLIKERK